MYIKRATQSFLVHDPFNKKLFFCDPNNTWHFRLFSIYFIRSKPASPQFNMFWCTYNTDLSPGSVASGFRVWIWPTFYKSQQNKLLFLLILYFQQMSWKFCVEGLNNGERSFKCHKHMWTFSSKFWDINHLLKETKEILHTTFDFTLNIPLQ